jgi:hypothetical protein
MGLKETVFHGVAQLIVERPARKRTLEEWAQRLESTLGEIDARAAASTDDAWGAPQFGHIIGIERWGQSRLRVFLGAPLLQDEYDAYKPETGLTVSELREVMRATRAETVALARELAARQIPLDATVPHNDFGPLTARGWLSYLNDHATREATRIR